MPSAFHVCARYVLLTYAQCGALDPWSVSDYLSTLGAECIVARENHVAGGTHLHAFVDFGKRFRSRRVDIFDVDGCHPNIVPSKGRPWGGWDYATKDGEIVAGGLARPSEHDPAGNVSTWGTIIGAESESEFWQLVEELAPKELCTQYGQLRKFADWRFAQEPERYVSPAGINFELGVVPELAAWRGFRTSDGLVGGKCTAAPRVGGTVRG